MQISEHTTADDSFSTQAESGVCDIGYSISKAIFLLEYNVALQQKIILINVANIRSEEVITLAFFSALYFTNFSSLRMIKYVILLNIPFSVISA